MMTTTSKAVASGRTELEIEIDAAPAKVWSAYRDDIAAWWPKDFLVTGSPGAMRFEAEPGGRLVEIADDGSGVLWATVLAMEAGRSIDLVSYLSEPYGGPATSYHRLVLADNGRGGTTLQATDWVVGAIDDGLADRMRDGWRTIYGSLRDHI